MIENDIKIKYSVGALLYTPAINQKIAEAVITEKISHPYSLALCLEDAIGNEIVKEAENQVLISMKTIFEASKLQDFFMPKIFIRVRKPEQITYLYKLIEPYSQILTGFICPKYCVENSSFYNRQIMEINSKSSKKIWMMPILESHDMIDLIKRNETLGKIRMSINDVKEYVLNVRVGGNDFSNYFSARRHYDETIYDILPISQLLGDIITFFSQDYVVSGPVWEYFSSENDEWKDGLRAELKLDQLNGFIGKTVIHPKQIPIVNEMMRILKKDYEDATTILHWKDHCLQVGKGFAGERMNEVQTHYNWAKKEILISEIYGVS